MKDDGGQAFPVSGIDGVVDYGMTLRDHFAAQAVAGGLARDTMREYELQALFGKFRAGITRAEIVAADAYQIADAMIEARARGQGEGSRLRATD